MQHQCKLLDGAICRHWVIGPQIVYQHDCDTCIAFDGRDSEEMQALARYREQVLTISPPNTIGRCRHLGTKLRVAECCGQMYACKFHKGKKCAIAGIAKEPFLSCQTCPDFDSIDGLTPTIIDRERFAGRCVAVTSLSPNPERAARQELCLQSWRDIGLEVITVDTAAKPRIKTLLDAGAETGLPFLLINADIEISGDHALIEAAIQQPEKLTIGIRYNHAPDASRGRSQKEAAGLDAFLMTPEMAATVPDLPFTIGYPVWDYWLPYHFRSLGHAFHWIDSPLFFHATHELQWSREDWVRGSAWLNDHYGINLTYGNTEFRESLSDHSKC
jgi:hypothetical protein